MSDPTSHLIGEMCTVNIRPVNMAANGSPQRNITPLQHGSGLNGLALPNVDPNGVPASHNVTQSNDPNTGDDVSDAASFHTADTEWDVVEGTKGWSVQNGGKHGSNSGTFTRLKKTIISDCPSHDAAPLSISAASLLSNLASLTYSIAHGQMQHGGIGTAGVVTTAVPILCNFIREQINQASASRNDISRLHDGYQYASTPQYQSIYSGLPGQAASKRRCPSMIVGDHWKREKAEQEARGYRFDQW